MVVNLLPNICRIKINRKHLTSLLLMWCWSSLWCVTDVFHLAKLIETANGFILVCVLGSESKGLPESIEKSGMGVMVNKEETSSCWVENINYCIV